MKLNFDKVGLTGDNLKFYEDLEKRMADLPESPSKADIVKEVRAGLTGLVKPDGSTAIDFDNLADLMGDDETKSIKGLRSALIKQGEKINAMQERSAELAEKDPLAAILLKFKPEIEKRFNSPNSREELRLNIRAAATMALNNTIDTTTNAIPTDLVESMSMDAFVKKRRGIQYIASIASVTTVAEITEYKTWLEEGNEQGAFALVAEGGLKPLVSTSLVRNVNKYKKVAGKYVVTEEFPKFYANLYNIIKTLLNDKMVRDYNAILSADLTAVSAGYTGSALDGTFATIPPNDYDAIGAVASQIMSLNFIPDTLVLNPQDLWRIRLEKNTQGSYLFPVVTSEGVTTIFEFNVVVSTYQAVGKFKLAESGLFKIEQEAIQVRMGYGIDVTTGTVSGQTVVTAVSSDLDNNRMRTIVEVFFHDYLATNNIGSVVEAQFSTVKTALA